MKKIVTAKPLTAVAYVVKKHSTTETAVRNRAQRMRYRVEKSRQRDHFNDQGRFQLIECGTVILGVSFDATLESIAEYLDKVAEKRLRWGLTLEGEKRGREAGR